jgi:hypothetical protein
MVTLYVLVIGSLYMFALFMIHDVVLLFFVCVYLLWIFPKHSPSFRMRQVIGPQTRDLSLGFVDQVASARQTQQMQVDHIHFIQNMSLVSISIHFSLFVA